MGKRYCSIRACPTRDMEDVKGTGIICHAFPANQQFKEEWEKFVNRCNRTIGFKAYKGALVCSAHFTPESYGTSSKGYLKRGSYPTIEPEMTKEIAFKYGVISSLDDEIPSTAELIASVKGGCKRSSTGDEESSDANEMRSLAEERQVVQEPPSSSNPEHACQNLVKGTLIDVLQLPPPTAKRKLYAGNGNSVQTVKEAESDLNSDNLSTSEMADMNRDQTFVTPSSKSKCSTGLKGKCEGRGKESDAACCRDGDVTPVANKRRCYIGDFTPSAFKSPESIARSLKILQRGSDATRHKVRMLQQKLRRALKKVHDLNSLLEHLRDENRVTDDVSSLMQAGVRQVMVALSA